MLIDEEGLLKPNHANMIGSYLYKFDEHKIPIAGNILFVGEEWTRDGIDFCGIEDETFKLLHLELKKYGNGNESYKGGYELMKILHTADWHLGTFRSPVKDGVNLRTEDTKRCLNEMIRVAGRRKTGLFTGIWRYIPFRKDMVGQML